MRVRALPPHWVMVLTLVCCLTSRVNGQGSRSVVPDSTHTCASESDERGGIIGRHLDLSLRGILMDSVFAPHRAELGLVPTTPITTVTDAALCARVAAALDAGERRGRVNAGQPIWVRQVGPYLAMTDAVPTAGEWATLWFLDSEFRVRHRYAF